MPPDADPSKRALAIYREQRLVAALLPWAGPVCHYDLISLLLTIIVLGGMGSLPGTIVAGLLMGVSEALLATYISPVLAKLTFFILLIAVLVVRPQGLFGTVERGRL
jgi:branched-chain amino acid transport system permease protein